MHFRNEVIVHSKLHMRQQNGDKRHWFHCLKVLGASIAILFATIPDMTGQIVVPQPGYISNIPVVGITLTHSGPITGLALDSSRNLYVSDGSTCQVYKVTASTGVWSVIAGTGTCGWGNDDGQLATNAELNGPQGIAIDRSGNIYIADDLNYRVRMVAARTGIISTILGTGSSGYSGDGGPAVNAKIGRVLAGVAVDFNGNVYVADMDNSRVRKITASSGVVDTVAGNGTNGITGDGGLAINAEIGASALALDAAGNVYIGDGFDVRVVNVSTRIINTVAGGGTKGFSPVPCGPAIGAQFNNAQGLAVDGAGNIYIADANNNVVRQVTGSTICTFAGTGAAGYSGMGGLAVNADISLPIALAADSAGDLYISEGPSIVGSTNAIATADYYIAPATGPVIAPCVNGSDSTGTGALSKPYASLNTVRQKVQSLLGSKSLTVMLCGGTYYNSSTAFGSSDSPGAGTPVTYTNFPYQTPILSGGIALNAANGFNQWQDIHISNPTLCNSNPVCWQLTLPTNPNYATTNYFERLWYNGSVRYRPKAGATASNLTGAYGTIASCGTCTNTASFAYTAGDPDMSSAGTWTNLNDVEIWDFDKWVASIVRISSINTSSHVITLTCNPSGNGPGACPFNPGGSGLVAWSPGNRYQIDNVKQLLRYPGQWYLDRKASPPTLTYIGFTGENPNNDFPGIVVGGYNSSSSCPQQVLCATGLQNTTFSGIQFQNDNYNVPSGGYQSIQLDPYLNYTGTASQGLISAMVSCSGCTNVTFSGDTFTQSTLNGLEFIGQSTSDTISNNMVYDIGGYGIKVGNNPNGQSDSTVPNHMLVTNNAVSGTGRFFPTGDDVMLGLANNIEISFNDLGYSYHDGIEVCKPDPVGRCVGGTGSGGTANINIHDNDIHNIMQGVTNDGGCVYTNTNLNNTGTSSAVGNVITHNRCHDVNDARAQYLNNSNYIKNGGDGYGGHCWYHDQTTGLWNDSENLCYRVTGVGFNMTSGAQAANLANTFSNNILAFTMQSVGGVQNCTPSSTVKQFNFTSNIAVMDTYPSIPAWGIANQTIYTIQRGNGDLFFSPPTNTQNWGDNFYYNFTSPGYCGSSTTGCNSPQFKSVASKCGNTATTYSDLAQWQNFGEDGGSSVTTNPGFTAVTACTATNTIGTNWPYPSPGVCDDYTPSAFPPNFSTFSMQFGRTSGRQVPIVPDTFLTATFSASAF